eukprot:Gb_05058 [translate_table: standard]
MASVQSYVEPAPVSEQFFPTANESKVLRQIFVRDEDERPKVAYNNFSKDIPIISLSGIDGEERGRVREEVKAACEEWGIFQVVNHGVSNDLLDRMSRLSTDFFALPPEEKLKYDMRGGKRGGFVADMEYRTDCREVVEQYSQELMTLASKLLEIISESLGLESQAVSKACLEMDQKVVVNFYPKCPQPDMTLGLKRHTDPGTITLLLQDQVGGLQATKDGHTWITVEPIQGAFVVNLGDHMHFLSNGRFKNADHQAVVNSNTCRLSIATFQNPAQEAIVYPLDGVVNVEPAEKCIMEEPITFAQMYSRKMNRDLELARLKKMAKLKEEHESK